MLVVFQVKSVSDLISKYIKCRLSLSNKDLEIEQFSSLNDVIIKIAGCFVRRFRRFVKIK